MKKRLTELDSDPKYKNLVGKRVVFTGGDKNKVWVGKVDFIGTNPTHGKLQITINRTPVWPVDIKSLKVIPKFNNPGQEMGWFLDNNYVTHRGSDGMEYKLENTMNLKEWTENYIKSINENNLEEKLNSLLEKNVPNDPSKWSYYKSQAKKKFDVYPSAYANAWAAKKYKAAGGTWKKESVNEGVRIPKNIEEFAKRKGILDVVEKVAEWVEKLGKTIKGGTAIGKGYNTLILDLTHHGGEISIEADRINRGEIKVYGERTMFFNNFKKALEESVNEDLPTKETDPSEFPNPLTNTKGFLKKGNYDGDVKDDLVPTKPVSISVSNLKPSQDAIYLGKALGMAIVGVEGGDLGAVISKDNYILDGHHRYAATTFNNPSAKVGGVQADLMIGDLVPVLRAVGDAMKNKRGLEPKGGDVNIFKATMDDVKAAVYDGKNMDSKFYNKEKSIAWFEKIGEKTIAQRLKMLQSKRPPSGAPARKDMPKIHPNQLGILKTLLNKGNIDVRKPYAESVNEANGKYLLVIRDGRNGRKFTYRYSEHDTPKLGGRQIPASKAKQLMKDTSIIVKNWIDTGNNYIPESVNEGIKKGDFVKNLSGELGLVNKVSGRTAYVKFPSTGSKSFDTAFVQYLKPSSEKHKGRPVYIEESVNESWVDDYGKAVQKARGGYQMRMSSGNYSVIIGKTLDGFFGVLLVNTRGGKMGTTTGIRYNNKSRDKVAKWAEKELKKVSKEPIVKESVNEAMDKTQLKKIYDNLQKGDEITIGYSSVMGGKSVGEFIVTKGKTKVGKARVERITLINKKNPRGVKYYLYQRNGFVTFAIGNLGAVINSITLKESVNEAYIVTYTKKKGEKPSAAAYRDKDMALKFEKDLKKDGYITMVTQKKVKGVDESLNEDYYKSASQAVDYARKMIEKRGFEIDEDDWNTGIAQGGKYNRLRPGVGKTHSYSIGLLKNGKPQRKQLQISLYGMPSGNYELTYYVN